MRALVTGANGFAGRVLCHYLTARDWEVVPCARDAVTHMDGAVHCDLQDPNAVFDTILKTGGLTHVFHLAALTFVPEAIEDPAQAFSVNTLGTTHLVQAIKQHAPHLRLVYVSSSEIYGPPQYLPVDEAHPLAPANPYSISKSAADAYVRYAAGAHGVDVAVARPFNHSGPGQDARFVLSSFARQVARSEAGQSEPVIRVGNLAARRDFTHVDDVVAGYEAVALHGESGRAYNICSGEAHAIQAALDFLLDSATLDIRAEVDEARLRPVDVPEIRGSYARLHDAAGWAPSRRFEDLLTELLAYWRTVEGAT